MYPMADVCFNNIKLPIWHNSREELFLKMDEGISNSINHFGRL